MMMQTHIQCTYNLNQLSLEGARFANNVHEIRMLQQSQEFLRESEREVRVEKHRRELNFLLK